MTMEAETEATLPQAKKCQGLPATIRSQERGKKQILPLSPEEGTLPTP